MILDIKGNDFWFLCAKTCLFVCNNTWYFFISEITKLCTYSGQIWSKRNDTCLFIKLPEGIYLSSGVSNSKDESDDFLDKTELLPPGMHHKAICHTHWGDLIFPLFNNRNTHSCYKIKHIWSSFFHFLKYTSPREVLKGWLRFFSTDMQYGGSMLSYAQVLALLINLFQEVVFNGWLYTW